MNARTLVRLTLSAMIVYGGLFATPQAEAGMLGDLWNTVLSWFGGGSKKVDPQVEAQLTALLEKTNQSQNAVIASINETLTFQNQLQSISDEETKKKLDEKIQVMQQTVEANNETFLQLMQAREQLHAQGLSEKYEENFAPYLQKQQEIESYYTKIEDRYRELTAFVESSESSQEEQSSEAKPSSTLWQKAQAKNLIEEWLQLNGRDEWGGPKVEGAVIGRPQAAGNRDRYQYLYESFPEIRAFVQEKMGGSEEVEESAPQQTAEVELQVEPVEDTTPAASPSATPTAQPKPKAGMAFTNRYDNASIREERKKIYKKLLDLNVQGKMNSEEYKDLYLEYTKLGEKLK